MHFIAVRLTGRYVCVVFVGRQTIDYFGPSMYSYIYYIRIYSFYSFQAHHKCSLMDLRCLFNDSQPMFGLPRNVVEICAKHLDWRSILSQGSLCKWNVKCKCLQSVHSLIGINHVPNKSRPEGHIVVNCMIADFCRDGSLTHWQLYLSEVFGHFWHLRLEIINGWTWSMSQLCWNESSVELSMYELCLTLRNRGEGILISSTVGCRRAMKSAIRRYKESVCCSMDAVLRLGGL